MYAAFFGHVHPNYTQIGIEFGMLSIMFIDLIMEIYHKKFNQLRKKSNFQTRFYIRAFTLILLLAD
jgi:predicted branched-subunit amino acid permease